MSKPPGSERGQMPPEPQKTPFDGDGTPLKEETLAMKVVRLRREKMESIEKERNLQGDAELTLQMYAAELDFDEGAAGKMVESWREELRAIAGHVKELQALGLSISVHCFPVRTGGAGVSVEKNGHSVEIYSQYYDGYKSVYERFDGAEIMDMERQRNMWRIEKNIDLIKSAAKLFCKE